MQSHSHLTDRYKGNVTIYAPTMLSSPLMVSKCDFFLLLGKNETSARCGDFIRGVEGEGSDVSLLADNCLV